MAGFWIPWECGLTKKREILLISGRLGVSAREAAAMCMEVWEWAQEQSVDGVVAGLTAEDISRATGIMGLGEAMFNAGWVVVSEGGIQFPNWDRLNSKPAKERYLNATRVRHHRAQKAMERANNRNGGALHR